MLDGLGTAPLPPPHPDFVTAMGRTNDAIIFGGRVHLFVTGPAAEARALGRGVARQRARATTAARSPTSSARLKGDFYAIDPMLFSPAEVIVTAIETGESFHAGRLDPGLLDASFAG